jgi:hypothetical protein
VDGRDKPGHDEFNLIAKCSNLNAKSRRIREIARKMIMGSTVRAVAGAAR